MHSIIVLASCLAAVSVSALPASSSPSSPQPPAAAVPEPKRQSSSSYGLDPSNPVQWALGAGALGLWGGNAITRHRAQEQATAAVKDALQRQRQRLQEMHAEEIRKAQELARAEGHAKGKLDEERSTFYFFDDEFDCIEHLQQSLSERPDLTFEQAEYLRMGFHQAHTDLCTNHYQYHTADGKRYFKVPKKVTQRNRPYGDEPRQLTPQAASGNNPNGVRQKVQEKAGASMDRSAFALPNVDVRKGLSELKSVAGAVVKDVQKAKFVMPQIKAPPAKMVRPIIA